MAYVLVAIGALMAAAGLYTVAYSVLNTRFEEYWAALEVGATLTAGGVITIALGVAVRAISQLKAALTAAPLATAAATPTLGAVEPLPETTATPSPFDPSPAVAVEPAPTPAERTPHPLRPAIPSLPAVPPAAATAEPMTEPERVAPASQDELIPHPVPVPHEAVPVAVDLDERRFEETPDFDPHAVAAARPADDYKLETPSTPEHDLPARGLAAGVEAPSPPLPAPEMPDDWLDRAFAELDDELPVRKPTNRASAADPLSEPAARRAGPEPAMAEPAHAAASDPAPPPAPASPPPPAPPAPQVIGRYEADGTSYVMYADGSIEAQSSSGVYRFSSMAELKSFIET